MSRRGGPVDGGDSQPHSGHRQRKRDQFRHAGLDSFAEHEVLELLLFYAIPRRDTNGLAHRLIDKFGNLNAVLSASVDDLSNIEGMGESAAVLLRLVPEVYRRARLSITANETILDTTERQGEYFLDLFVAQPNEVLYQLCLDSKGKKLNIYTVSEGDVIGVGLNARRIVENALWSRAAKVVLAHNHPSGVAWPSPEDLAATRQIRDALELVGLTLEDHIIVADDDYVSMRLSGMI